MTSGYGHTLSYTAASQRIASPLRSPNAIDERLLLAALQPSTSQSAVDDHIELQQAFKPGIRGKQDVPVSNPPSRFPRGNIVFRGVVSILTGQGIDTVECGNSFESSDRVRFKQAVTISTGTQEDLVDLRKSVFEKSIVVDVGGNDLNSMTQGVFIRDVQVKGLAFFRSAGRASINIEAVPDSTSPSRFGSAVVFALQSGRVTIGNELHTTPKVIFQGTHTYIGTDSTISVKFAGPIQANPSKRRLILAILE